VCISASLSPCCCPCSRGSLTALERLSKRLSTGSRTALQRLSGGSLTAL
jgi:hypothetical protein